ncbi:MAG: GNAT family N-acetyltransferase [Ruminococcus sp.]|nr:GNAT family N-acetyltransferase [Ruminococcus sp.]MCM1478390.1 GNAT family N-acetyltransferase [Muribaculaceae bacterium]
MIRKATAEERDIVAELVRETVEAVYPKYYPAGAVEFFIAHHKPEKIAADIGAGKVFVFEENGAVSGTVTVDGNEIARLFVKPSRQGNGFGGRLLDFAEKMIFGYSETVRLDSSLPAKGIYIKRGYAEKEYRKILTDSGDFLCYDVMEKGKAGAQKEKA